MKKTSARFTVNTPSEYEPYSITEIVTIVSDEGVYDESIRRYPYLTVEDVRAGRTGRVENPKLSVSDVVLCFGFIVGILALMILAEKFLQ
jgi:hypothetical protein